jgi:hypothetical protein
VVSLRSTTGYRLESLRDGGGPESNGRSTLTRMPEASRQGCQPRRAVPDTSAELDFTHEWISSDPPLNARPSTLNFLPALAA